MAETKIVILPMDEQQWGLLGVKQEGAPLLTIMNVVEGEILQFMEGKGEMTMTYLISRIGWPEAIVMMAIGGLVKDGLVEAKRFHKFILLTKKDP